MLFDVSVIIPTYNQASIIGHTLCSVLNQTLPPKEIIVVDDGSTDNTEDVVKTFAPRVKYLRIDNSGVCRARNVGVAASSSSWLAFCDHDDLWIPNKLEVQARLIEKAPDVEYVFTNFKIVSNDVWSDQTKFDSLPENFWNVNKRIVEDIFIVIDTPLFHKILYNQPIFPSTVLIKRSLFNCIGGFEESIGRNPSEDLEFTLRCVNRKPIGVVLIPLVGLRKHENNFSNNLLRNKIGEIDILKFVISRHNLSSHDIIVVNQQIIERTSSAVIQAFAAGELETVVKYFATIPFKHRSWKMYLKVFIAKLPETTGSRVRHFMIKIAHVFRMYK